MKIFIFFILLLNYPVIVFSQSRLTPPKPERIRTYDVLHIDIKIIPDMKERKVTGSVKTKIIPLNDGFSEFETDAVEFDIKSIRDLKGTELNYDYDRDKIMIKPGKTLSRSDTLVYTVEYECSPQKGMHFIYPDEFNPSLPYQIWTQGETEYNKYWIPLYDYPNDKTSWEITSVIENKYKTLSNGYLAHSKEIEGTGLREDHWIMDKPNSTYLIMFAAGEFNVIEDNYDGVPIYSYTGVDVNKEDAEFTFRNTGMMMKAFNEFFGYEYPWNKYSQITVDNFIHGGMENTTATVLNKRLIINEKILPNYNSESTIAHELGHQWWGDLLTCRNWSEFWLNESFATFSDAVWKEYAYGKDEYDYEILRNFDNAIRADSVTGRYPINGRYGNLTPNVYGKGAVILSAMRHILGDKFKPMLKTFLENNEYDIVEAKDFKDAINKVTGENYDWMTEQWIEKAGYPEFEVEYKYDEKEKEVILKIRQVQKTDSLTPIFRVPLDVRIKSASENKLQEIVIMKEEEEISIPFSEQPEFIVFDYGNKIPDRTFFSKSYTDWKNQIEQSEDAIDRITGLRGLEMFLKHENSGESSDQTEITKSTEGLDIFVNSLNTDKFWGVRNEAASILGRNFLNEKILHALTESYEKQNNPRVKRAVINALGKSDMKAGRDFLLNILNEETDEYIIAECISALKNCLPKNEIYDNLIRFLNTESHRQVIKDNLIEALDSADNEVDDERIKTALAGIAFGRDTEAYLRTKAINALRKYAADDDIKENAKKLAEGSFIFSRRAAINLLSSSGDKTMTSFLEQLNNKTTDRELKNFISSAIKKLEEDVK